ncbi:MAG: phosphoribosylglycinamide formyltransferase [Deltaproteobacteria bacterium]|nr:phosphoribosylglycinamide formyltransferase [Deltaproteobacteria bacterium]NCP01819.1 phosphoribosylglycinamide formyltransferase [Deltaproteobacteria bacterium]NCP78192.1 phosphoribosylglycinamide formyltransferase [Desulfuromonadales bacterium]
MNSATPSLKLQLGILASGSGSNLQAIIDRCNDSSLQANIALVISNNPEAFALQRAAQAGISHCCIDHRQFEQRDDFERAVVAKLQESKVELVVLAGFMRLIGDTFLHAFPQRIINIHPALLPAFPGLHVQQKALDYGAKFSGCTVHLVDSGVDTGPIIMQAVVPVYDDDSADDLAARILVEEHKIYPRAIQLLAAGRLKIEGRRVRSVPAFPPTPVALHNPPLQND